MFWSTQTILRFYWKAAPKNEGYEGHTGTNKKDEIFNRLKLKRHLVYYHIKNVKIIEQLIDELIDCQLTGSSPNNKLLITKKRSSQGVIIILKSFLFNTSHLNNVFRHCLVHFCSKISATHMTRNYHYCWSKFSRCFYSILRSLMTIVHSECASWDF